VLNAKWTYQKKTKQNGVRNKMEVDNKFLVEVTEDGLIHVIQTITKTMKLEESIIEYNKMMQEHTQIQQQKEKMQKYIDDNEAEKSLKALEENDVTVSKLKDVWTEKTEPLMEEYAKKVRSEIAKEKLKQGFVRENDVNKKAVMRANIMGKVSNDFQLDVNHPIVQKLRQDFEKI